MEVRQVKALHAVHKGGLHSACAAQFDTHSGRPVPRGQVSDRQAETRQAARARQLD